MQLLGTYGQMAQDRLRGRGAALTGEAVDTTITAVAAAAAGYLSAKSNLKGSSGKLAGLPIPLVGALILGGAAAAGVGGAANHHLMSAAKGALAAQAAMFGIKAAYPTGTPATIAAFPVNHMPGNLPAGTVYHGGRPYMGATPATEQMFARAGLAQ